MGKKPVVVVVGLIWAGMVLVGCENCKSCRRKDSPAPAYEIRNGGPGGKEMTPTPPVPSVVTPTATAGGAAKPETAKAVDPVGATGFDKSAVGTPVSAGSPPPSGIQSTLSPNTDGRPVALPGQGADYRSGENPISKATPSDGGFRLPLRPVSQVGASVAEPLPPIAEQSAFSRSPLATSGLTQPPTSPTRSGLTQPPTSPTPSGLTQPPTSPSPMPGTAGNNMPGIDSIPN